MIIRRPLLIACVCLLGFDTVSAAQSAPVSGVIRFSGTIVEASCMAGGASHASVELLDCPHASTGQAFSVTDVSAAGRGESHQQVFVKMIADTHEHDNYYDQRLLLTDNKGHPITTGNYVVTLTLP
ncbi:type 1 fimbrial protein [Pseudomonas sp. B21-051]|uniref:type 1 fimbrial protein n=1 Tax=Pseudomonas sp. B21-051 TaxID=2895491 RepID=UPI00215EC243|nr:type 1 fimbrial protein [Pseudomonas sp. B21-051]UVK90124.1 type 1 fimbrial protein [Pseudomonas sp. B21-051]